jgi:hypothetical protein
LKNLNARHPEFRNSGTIPIPSALAAHLGLSYSFRTFEKTNKPSGERDL